MRYVKCDKCNKDISGQPKIVMSYISETRGKHRNAEKKEMVRFCVECGKKSFYHMFPYGAFDWDKETFEEMVFNSDKKQGEVRYTKMKVKKEKYPAIPNEKGENDAIWLLKDVTKYQSKKALLLQKISQIANKYRILGPSYFPDDIEDVITCYEISSQLGDIIEKLGSGVNRFVLNTERSFNTVERTSINHIDGVLVKTIHPKSNDLVNIKKWLNTVEHHYIDKMADELKDQEYRSIVIDALKALYDSHNTGLIKKKVFVNDFEKNIIDI
jgi:hypothetical protein